MSNRQERRLRRRAATRQPAPPAPPAEARPQIKIQILVAGFIHENAIGLVLADKNCDPPKVLQEVFIPPEGAVGLAQRLVKEAERVMAANRPLVTLVGL